MNLNNKFPINNFDLIRLIAALQVVIHHGVIHLDIELKSTWILYLLDAIPGVPIFFFISGYLISRSYENNHLIKEYAQNRLLRIYPALFFCVFLSFLSVYSLGYFSTINPSFSDFTIWLVGQASFYQFYNPDFMRAYGVGVLNGSLWTISVELQFYVLVPILYFIMRKFSQYNINTLLFVFFVVFAVLNRVYYFYNDEYNSNIVYKMIGVTFIPWFYMFIMGVIFQKNFIFLYNALAGKYSTFFFLYVLFVLINANVLDGGTGNLISPLVFVSLSIFIFSVAYSYVGFSKILLNRNDISYGVYIYHMPIINSFLYVGLSGDFVYLVYVIAITMMLSFLSWKVIECPSLKLKRHPLNPFRN